MKKALFGVISVLAILVLGYIWAHQWMAFRATKKDLRDWFFALVRPVKVTNCTLERFGSPHDGGYLMCSNLLDKAEVAYSYGIAGDDNWGCDISKRYKLTVHEYDCFNPTRPSCGGTLNFHDECVADSAFRDGDRPFDSVVNQIVRNGDAGKHIVMKMDVEGAEVDSLLAVPDEQLDKIEQLAIELHWIDRPKSVQLLQKLRRTFQIAYLHSNNYACHKADPPFSSEANELLFVNKRLAIVDSKDTSVPAVSALAAVNNPKKPDCQPTWP